MKKIINVLILSIVFSSVAHSEPNEVESNLSEICKSVLLMSMFASGIENECGFRDGLSGKSSAFFISKGCKIPEGKSGDFEKAQSELNALTQKALKVKGRKVGCKSAREAYVPMIQALKELQAAVTQDATKPDVDVEYYPVSLDDLKIDADSLNGRKVRVNGLGYYVMNSFMLKKSAADMSPIFINIENLKRDQKQQILNKCGDIMTGCSVGVYGTAGKVSYQNGVIAENIKW